MIALDANRQMSVRAERGCSLHASIQTRGARSKSRQASDDMVEHRNPNLFPVDLLNEDVRSAGNGQTWWLVHTKPRQEKRLAEEMLRHKVAHYLPVTYCKATSRGRDRFAWLPLFPGYMFLQCNEEGRLAALKTNRVVAIQAVADTLLLHRQLATLADLIDLGVPLRVEERIEPGREVEVKSGTLRGKRGVVIRRGGRCRLFIAIAEVLGGVSLELEIEHHLIEPV